jgi:hypothetical protein
MDPATPGRAEITTVLLDADGTPFFSEEPAFEASAEVTRAFAERFGLTGDFSPDHLRRTTTGKNFRTTAQDLRFSAEDSLPVPTGKPDPAVYEPAPRPGGCSIGGAVRGGLGHRCGVRDRGRHRHYGPGAVRAGRRAGRAGGSPPRGRW